jgi:hypothetical protein
MWHLTGFFVNYKSILLAKSVFLLNAAFAVPILGLIFLVRLALFAIMLLK